VVDDEDSECCRQVDVAIGDKNKYDLAMLIATYIKSDLAARLKSGHEPPAQLTLDSLAEYYNVSFTPVRTAVAELIEEGLLKKGPNRRLVACAPPVSGSGKRTRCALKLPDPPRDPFETIASDFVLKQANAGLR
jgi:hypothetical protein